MYTILIVDDERPAQTFIKAICQKYCPAFDTILLSGSADDALRLMAQQHVHVLVTRTSVCRASTASNWLSASGSCIRGHIQ